MLVPELLKTNSKENKCSQLFHLLLPPTNRCNQRRASVSCSYGSPCPSCPLLIHFLITSHFIPHLSLISFHPSRGQKLCKNVRDLEHVDVSHCVALSDPAVRAISFYCRGLVTLRMAGCPKVHTHTHTLLKPSNVSWLESIVFPLVFSCHMFSIFFCPASDDRYGGAVSGKWISIPARTWCEWLRSSHRSHSPTLREDLSSALLHHDGLLQQHLQVRHKLRRASQSPESCTITFNVPESVCSLRLAALKLRPRVEYWEHSSDDPPYWFGHNMGQIVHPITRPSKTDDTLEVVEQHSAMTRAASTERI